MAIPLRPDGKFTGVFLTPPAGVTKAMFDNFNLDTWILQAAAIKSKGGNVLVHFGNVEAGKANLADYIRKRRAVNAALAKLGVYSLTYASYTPDSWGVGVTAADALTVFTADAAAQAQAPNCIGYVTMDEPDQSVGGGHFFATRADMLTVCSAQYSTLRAVVPANFPIITCPMIWGAINEAGIDEVAPYNDCFSFHQLGTSDSVGAFVDVIANNPGKRILFGSCGSLEDGDSRIPAFYSQYLGVVRANPEFSLASIFICTDYLGANTVGMWNSAGPPATAPTTERVVKTDAFEAGAVRLFPTTRPRYICGSPRANQVRQWG